ncbi:hypothetical protein BD779DRAFT_1526670 [Infundibulicybe gibba]|nr:hypothetical protein BD779DRAFT_1526670 [Infundibulicybe gibba]
MIRVAYNVGTEKYISLLTMSPPSPVWAYPHKGMQKFKQNKTNYEVWCKFCIHPRSGRSSIMKSKPRQVVTV